MAVFKTRKKRFYGLLGKLMRSYELIGPVKNDLVKFEKIENLNKIFLSDKSYFPVKEYFFRKQEVLFQFDGNKAFIPKIYTPKRIFFGLRKCDLNAVRHQDLVFNEVNDPYYIEARKNSYLIGYHCKEACSEYCFCGSLELVDFFDLMVYDKGSYYLIEIGSDKGQKLVDENLKFFDRTNKKISEEEKVIKGTDRLKNLDISGLYGHNDWNKGVELCLSCTACTVLCPACYCFSIYDEVKSKNPAKGQRNREWSSCQLQEFTRVANDFIFRAKREERFKHRIYHQLEYFKEKHGINLCVGCGRCIEGCPTRIDFVEIINNMK